MAQNQLLWVTFGHMTYHFRDISLKQRKLGLPHKPDIVHQTGNGPKYSLANVGSKLYYDVWP